MEVRRPVHPVQTHMFCEKCAIFIEPDNPAAKAQGYNYVSREEMDAARGYKESDEHLNRFTVFEILDELNKFSEVCDWPIEEIGRHFRKQDEIHKATMKFFGEMMFQGGQFMSINPTTGAQQTDYNHQCDNPSCKHEAIYQVLYPAQSTVESDKVRYPSDLPQPDEYLRKKLMGSHGGSTVVPDAEVVKPEEKE